MTLRLSTVPPARDADHAPLCPDCPVARVGALAAMIPPRAGSCAFRCLSLESRAPLPQRWFTDFTLGVVRRGMLVRERVDALGRSAAVDVVGPGGLVLLGMGLAGDRASVGGYAVGDVLLCAATAESVRAAMESDGQSARDLLRLQADALERIERFAEARGRTTVVERIAAVLLAIADAVGARPRGAHAIPADIQQVDLAALVTTRQETVCRSLRDLEQRRLIARDHEGIWILDRARLAQEVA